MLVFSTWLWGDAYGKRDVAILLAALRRNVAEPFRFLLFSERVVRVEGADTFGIPDIELTKIKGCFARLRLFDPEFQKACGIVEGDRVVNLDLDMVVTRPLGDLFDRKEPFVILSHINGTNPCPYNGSVWMFRAGHKPEVWSEFSLDAYRERKVPFHAFPDDQGWFWHMFPNAGAFGPAEGVYGFCKNGWPGGERLPPNAKIVAFPGWRKPAKFTHLDWVGKHWRI